MSKILNDIQVAPNFNLQEFESPHTHEIKIVPEVIYKLQALRILLDKPIQVTSGYRTLRHNAIVGGHVTSKHMRGLAVDIVVKDVDIDLLEFYAIEVGFKDVVYYENKGHFHLAIGG